MGGIGCDGEVGLFEGGGGGHSCGCLVSSDGVACLSWQGASRLFGVGSSCSLLCNSFLIRPDTWIERWMMRRIPDTMEEI